MIEHSKILKDNRNPQNHWGLEDESSSNGTMTYNICVCWSGPVKVQTSIQFSICGITLVWKCYEQFSSKQVEDNTNPDKYTNIELWTIDWATPEHTLFGFECVFCIMCHVIMFSKSYSALVDQACFPRFHYFFHWCFSWVLWVVHLLMQKSLIPFYLYFFI